MNSYEIIDTIITAIGTRFFKTWIIPLTELWGGRILESVGAEWYLAPTPTSGCPGDIDGYAPNQHRCYEENGEVYHFYPQECDYVEHINSTKSLSSALKVVITPNPVRDEIQIWLNPASIDHNMSVSLCTSL